MKFRYEIVYRAGLALLLIIAFWSVWANAQPSGATNLPPVPAETGSTNQFERSMSFGLDKFEFLRDHTLFGPPLWKYAASLIYIILAFCVAWLLDLLVGVWLQRLAAKTKTEVDDLLLKLLRGPLKIVAFVILLNVGLGVFDWPPRAQLMLSRGLIVVVACSLTYMAMKLADLFIALWRGKIVSTQDRV